MKTSNKQKIQKFWKLLNEGQSFEIIISLIILLMPIGVFAIIYPTLKLYYVEFHHKIGELAYLSYIFQFLVGLCSLAYFETIVVFYLSVFIELRSSEELKEELSKNKTTENYEKI